MSNNIFSLFDLETSEDGIFLSVEGGEEAGLVNLENILDFLEMHSIYPDELSTSSMLEAIEHYKKNLEPIERIKIEEKNISPELMDPLPYMEVDIPEGGAMAKLKTNIPENFGRKIRRKDIDRLLSKYNIRFGVKDKLIEQNLKLMNSNFGKELNNLILAVAQPLKKGKQARFLLSPKINKLLKKTDYIRIRKEDKQLYKKLVHVMRYSEKKLPTNSLLAKLEMPELPTKGISVTGATISVPAETLQGKQFSLPEIEVSDLVTEKKDRNSFYFYTGSKGIPVLKFNKQLDLIRNFQGYFAIDVTEDKMQAFLSLRYSEEVPGDLYQQIITALKKKGIKRANLKLIEHYCNKILSKEIREIHQVLISNGLEPEHGQDESFQFNWPVYNDYRYQSELAALQWPEKYEFKILPQGEKIGRKIPKKDPGMDGETIFGETLPAMAASTYSTNFNDQVELQDDELHSLGEGELFIEASENGLYIEVHSPAIFEESPEEGWPAFFEGNVYIKCEIEEGTVLKGKRDFFIEGDIDKVSIETDGYIFIRGSYHGANSHSLKAGLGIYTQDLFSARVFSGGDVQVAMNIKNSQVYSEGSVYCGLLENEGTVYASLILFTGDLVCDYLGHPDLSKEDVITLFPSRSQAHHIKIKKLEKRLSSLKTELEKIREQKKKLFGKGKKQEEETLENLKKHRSEIEKLETEADLDLTSFIKVRKSMNPIVDIFTHKNKHSVGVKYSGLQLEVFSGEVLFHVY